MNFQVVAGNNGTPTDFLATAGDEHDYSKPMHSTVLSPSLHMMSEINPAVTTVAQVVGARSSLRGRRYFCVVVFFEDVF